MTAKTIEPAKTGLFVQKLIPSDLEYSRLRSTSTSSRTCSHITNTEASDYECRDGNNYPDDILKISVLSRLKSGTAVDPV
jgi:hypothetical protein